VLNTALAGLNHSSFLTGNKPKKQSFLNAYDISMGVSKQALKIIWNLQTGNNRWMEKVA
jgi:hypothetical protein